MTPPAPPGDPCRESPARPARRLLDDRHVMDAEPADFSKNPHFDRLHGGNPDGPEKPAILFTACLHDLLAQGDAVPGDIAKWITPSLSVTVDGRATLVLWTDRAAARSVLAVERGSTAHCGGDVIMYRELHPGGLREWGASGLFFGPNGRGSTGLRLCHMAGELRVFLEHLALLCARIGLGGPLMVFPSIRNSSRLVQGGYGTGEPARPPYPGQGLAACPRRPRHKQRQHTVVARLWLRRRAGRQGRRAGDRGHDGARLRRVQRGRPGMPHRRGAPLGPVAARQERGAEEAPAVKTAASGAHGTALLLGAKRSREETGVDTCA